MNSPVPDLERTGTPKVAAGLPAELSLPQPYEKPSLQFMGSLSNLLGKSGIRSDYTYRRANNGRP